MYLGDFKEDGDIFFKFTTRAFATGIPTTLDGSPVLSVYKDEGGAATEKTTAEAYFDLDVDHDSIAGWNNVRIDLSGDAFFATGADYSVVITTGTVDSVNVFGENLANFSIENRFAEVDVTKWLGTAVAAATAGRPDVNVEAINNTTGSADVLSSWLSQGTAPTADSGTTTTLVDSVLTEADDYWNGSLLVFRSGTNQGYSAIVTDFDAASDTLTFTPAVPSNVTTEGYVLIPGLGWAMMADAGLENTKTNWDRILTGSTHNIATSAGRRLRQLEASFVVTAGTAQGGGAASITLATGESATNDIFAGDRVIIVGGTGIGEHGIITTYDGGTKVATMSQNWVIQPIAGSEYELSPADVDVETWQHAIVSVSAASALPEVDAKSISDSAVAADRLEASAETIVVGAAEAGTLSTTQMTSDLSEATDDHYNGRIVIWTSGDLKDQASDITDYLGATGMLTYTAVTEAPGAADTFVIV